MDLVRPGQENMQSTGLVDQIHPGHPDLPKIISQWGFCKNAPLRSRLDTTIQMLLETPPNKKPYPRQYIKSSPYRNFCQVHEENLWTMISSAWIYSPRLKLVVPNPQANEKCEDHFDTYGRRHGL